MISPEKAEPARKRKAAFQTCFKGLYGAEVLGYLTGICRAYESTYVPNDPYATAYNEGKRAVFLYIYDQLNLSVEELTENYDRFLRMQPADFGRPV